MTGIFFSPFFMVIAVVAIAVFGGLIKEMYQMRLEHRSGSKEVLNTIEALVGKMEKIERRMSNIESIVIEREKEHSFENALRSPRD